MTTLDRVTQLQQSGMNDEQISTQLQQEGISPKEILDSLNQARIKSAVSDNPNSGIVEQTYSVPQLQQTQQPMAPMAQPIQSTMPTPQGMQSSISDMSGQQQWAQPNQEQYSQPPTAPAGQDAYAGYYPETGTYQEGYYEQPMMDTETITQIAEQVVTEKFKNFTNDTGDLVSFKTTTQDKLADLDNRLVRIEKTIDKLQQAIIQKIGDFGESNAMIQKDLENLHETTSKLMNPLIDNYRAMTEKKSSHRTTHKK